jgi:hypothetical protein
MSGRRLTPHDRLTAECALSTQEVYFRCTFRAGKQQGMVCPPKICRHHDRPDLLLPPAPSAFAFSSAQKTCQSWAAKAMKKSKNCERTMKRSRRSSSVSNAPSGSCSPPESPPPVEISSPSPSSSSSEEMSGCTGEAEWDGDRRREFRSTGLQNAVQGKQDFPRFGARFPQRDSRRLRNAAFCIRRNV